MTAPLAGDDPAEIGPYRLLGRLGAGGQGVVYLAAGRDGEHVALKVLRHVRDEEDLAAFRREGEILRRVARFCTAPVLDSGTDGGVPYLVSEHVDGPSLSSVIAERGPMAGTALFRLAVGTLTALAAIHHAGVAHLDFKPGNVLLGRGGPRVIDFGISRVLDATHLTGGLVGTPAYMAPEHFREELTVGPPADLFAWGGTVLYAATGRQPFPGASIPVIMNGILNREPDLSVLEPRLRNVVAACLRKDPAERPTAREALLTLLGRAAGASLPGVLEQGSQIAETPTARRSALRNPRVAVAGAVAVSVAVTLAVLAPGLLSADRDTGPSSGRPTPPASPTAPPPSPVATRLPSTDVTAFDRPGDPVRLAAYAALRPDPQIAYARPPGSSAFTRIGVRQEPAVSPDGAWVALDDRSAVDGSADGQVTFIDTRTGTRFTVKTTEKPVITANPRWSPDGRRLLLTSHTVRGNTRTPRGFVIVEVATRTATRVDVPGDERMDEFDAYSWGPDSATLAHRTASGVRLQDLTGRVTRTYDATGTPAALVSSFSPSGDRFLTNCPDRDQTACVWRTSDGRAEGTFRTPGMLVWQWYDEDHLVVVDQNTAPNRLSVIDRDGREVRRLAEFPTLDTWIPALAG
ncbi:protein kinase [Thermopolyspora sp. NPDC052614]|uniref:WD40 repeat domain-containing serine/threonine protein kinase n=1 Tax=Thermopolyspora sp. NPDC052614 TaxID=3155682 RepID=UPI003445953D